MNQSACALQQGTDREKDVPVAGKIENFDQYDTVFLGFPIWYYAAPRVIYIFCKGYDWTGKKIYAFATSGGSGIGKTADKLSPYTEGAAVLKAVLVHNFAELSEWTKKLDV